MTAQEQRARVQRGIKLAAESAEQFERVRAFVWTVPSYTGRERYTVDLDLGYCTCEDYRRQRERGIKDHVCKHIAGTEIVSAKRHAVRLRRAA